MRGFVKRINKTNQQVGSGGDVLNHYIIGTAGHIDHGKTALIKALTGRDTDTKKEEKFRGITIDLGFTYFDLKSGARVGIVDVPGHEKFLPNMLSGVCGMDLVLLVIALDDGMMPQTIEHMEILKQLGVTYGIVVLTKLDCVEKDWADLMAQEIEIELQDTICENWPIISVSSKTGKGIDQLKDLIESEIEEMKSIKSIKYQHGKFRMPIDRVLTIEGRGTVITGTILEGAVAVDDVMRVYPSGEKVRIRAIQSHGQDEMCIEAGQRAALLLANVKEENIKRGDVIAEPDSMELTDRIDVKLNVSKYTKRILKNRSRIHFHIGTAHYIGRVVLYGCEEIGAGGETYAQILLEQSACMKNKDPFVIRFYSPLETMGGGMVLATRTTKHKRADKNLIDYFKSLENDDKGVILVEQILRKGNRLIPQDEWTSEEMNELRSLYTMQERSNWCSDCIAHVVMLHGKKKDYVTTEEMIRTWKNQIEDWAKVERERHPYRKAFPKGEMKKELFPKWNMTEFEILLKYLEQEKFLCTWKECVSVQSYPVVRDERFEQTRNDVIFQLEAAKCQFIHWEELCSKQMQLEVLKDILQVLEYDGEILWISNEFCTTTIQMEQIIEMVEKHFAEKEILTYTELRDALQTTRRSIRPLVAYLDQQKVTRPCGAETERIKG